MYSDGIDERLTELRDKAIVRIIDLTSKRVTMENRLHESRTTKKIQHYSDEIDYINISIKRNQDIIFHVADIDKDYSLEQ